MHISEIAAKVLAVKIKEKLTNNEFYKRYSSAEALEKTLPPKDFLNKMDAEGIGAVCVFDSEFPHINAKVPQGAKPYLLFYKGNIELLHQLNNNVAVIGLTTPESSIADRENEAVKCLVKEEQVIVSGLAKGCDTIAHQACLDADGKTIAILPSPLNAIFPAENRDLAARIVEAGGLLLSEYYDAPANSYEAIKRFTDRDRLQSMFAKAVLLIASYAQGEGDSGSRYAMEAAKKYGICRYVMFDERTDATNPQFALNRQYIEKNKDVCVLTRESVAIIADIVNTNLEREGLYQDLFHL